MGKFKLVVIFVKIGGHNTHSSSLTNGVKAMQVNREFSPEIAHKLEIIQELDLAFLLDQVPDRQEESNKLSEWQLQGIEKAERSIAGGRIVPREKVVKWIESWGTENELPIPQCD